MVYYSTRVHKPFPLSPLHLALLPGRQLKGCTPPTSSTPRAPEPHCQIVSWLVLRNSMAPGDGDDLWLLHREHNVQQPNLSRKPRYTPTPPNITPCAPAPNCQVANWLVLRDSMALTWRCIPATSP